MCQANSGRRDNTGGTGKTRGVRREAERRDEREERGGEGRGERGKSACPQGHEAITKLQKLTIKPDRHTGATIKLAGRPADRRIFLAFTTNHTATRRTSSGIYAFLSPRASTARAGGFFPRKENCTAILHRRSKCRCKTSALFAFLPIIPPASPATLLLRASMNPSDGTTREFALNHIFHVVSRSDVLNIIRQR